VRLVRGLAVLAGLLVAGWLVADIGPRVLWAELSRLSWRLALLMLPQALVSLLDGVGWRYAFPERLPDVGTAVTIRLAGEAVNDTTPTGQLGGDAVKAWLVGRARIPLTEGVVAAVVGKTALVISQVLFLAVGLAVALGHPGAAPGLTTGLAILTAAGLAAAAGFLWAQGRGLFRTGGRALEWIGLGGRLASGAIRLDADLRRYYRDRRGRLALSAALHLLGWLAGSLEVWLALRFLGAPIAPDVALVIEAAATGIRSAGFLIPASLGIQEGGLVAIFAALGLGGPLGLAFGAVRRIREATWILVGYACLAAWGGVAAPLAERRA
jgi:glycosyltransferase 2 family protein